MFVLKTGMACRYRVLQDGRRKILTFLLPGDLCDLHVFLIKEMDHCDCSHHTSSTRCHCARRYHELAVPESRISLGLWVQCHAGRGHAA